MKQKTDYINCRHQAGGETEPTSAVRPHRRPTSHAKRHVKKQDYR